MTFELYFDMLSALVKGIGAIYIVGLIIKSATTIITTKIMKR